MGPLTWRTRTGYALTVAAVSLVLVLPIGVTLAGALMGLTWPQHLWLALAALPLIAATAVLDLRGIRGWGVSLWFLSSCCWGSWLVVGAVAEHGVEDVDASSGQADDGGVVFLPCCSFAVVVGA